MNRVRKLSSSEILERAKRAERFLELASLSSESDDSASRATSVSNAVLAAIAAADVICSVEINQHSQTENHQEAIRMLKEAIPEKRSVVNAFSRL